MAYIEPSGHESLTPLQTPASSNFWGTGIGKMIAIQMWCQSNQLKVDNPPRFTAMEIAVHLSPVCPSFPLLTREKEREGHGTRPWALFAVPRREDRVGTG